MYFVVFSWNKKRSSAFIYYFSFTWFLGYKYTALPRQYLAFYAFKLFVLAVSLGSRIYMSVHCHVHSLSHSRLSVLWDSDQMMHFLLQDIFWISPLTLLLGLFVLCSLKIFALGTFIFVVISLHLCLFTSRLRPFGGQRAHCIHVFLDYIPGPGPSGAELSYKNLQVADVKLQEIPWVRY